MHHLRMLDSLANKTNTPCCCVQVLWFVKSCDAHGNHVPIDDVRHYAVHVEGPASAAARVCLQGDDASQAVVACTPTVAGQYAVSVRYEERHIKGSPWTLHVAPDRGRGLHSRVVQLPDSFTVGLAASVEVVVRDVHGNVSRGGDLVTVEVDNAHEGMRVDLTSAHFPRLGATGCTALAVVAGGNGTYTASYQPTRSGLATLRSTVNGETLGSPVTLPLHPAAVASLQLCQQGPWTCDAGRDAERVVAWDDAWFRCLLNVHKDDETTASSIDRRSIPAAGASQGCVWQPTDPGRCFVGGHGARRRRGSMAGHGVRPGRWHLHGVRNHHAGR